MYNVAGCGVVLEGEVILASQADTTNACSTLFTKQTIVVSIPKVQNKDICKGEHVRKVGRYRGL